VNFMSNMKNLKMAMILSSVLPLAMLGGFSLPSGGEIRESTVPTKEELEWMEGLNPYRRKEWQGRFRQGLTKEQRAYVTEQLED